MSREFHPYHAVAALMEFINWSIVQVFAIMQPCSTIALMLAAKAYAFLKGRGYVTPQDVKSIGMAMLRHRVAITYEAEKKPAKRSSRKSSMNCRGLELMKLIFNSCMVGLSLSLLLMCSCATDSSIRFRLPADVALDKDIARGGKLIVMLRLENGEELPFYVDTGSPATVFDKSLEPELRQRLGTVTLWNFGAKEVGGVYKAPKLYLGDTLLLLTGNGVVTSDCRPMSINVGHPIMGVLGMDVLEHYCIQLDFAAGKMSFRNPRHLNRAKLGKAFPILFSSEDESMKRLTRPYILNFSLIGAEATNVLIDTGYPGDAALDSGLFRREIMEHSLQGEDAVWFKECVWNGEIYTNLLVGDGANLIGLRFLARHLVTLDFPERRMYLKQTRVGSWTDETINGPEVFLNNLKENGQLPGWSKLDKGTIYWQAFPDFDEFDGRKTGDPTDYHYNVVRNVENNSWKLQKAWRTDQNDNLIEEFPIP